MVSSGWVHSFQQFIKTWVGAQVVEPRVYLELSNAYAAFIDALTQPEEGFVFIAEVGRLSRSSIGITQLSQWPHDSIGSSV